MKWSKRVLRITVILFLLLWPVYIFIIKNNDMFNKEEKTWSGVITMWDYPRLDIEKGTRYNWITGIIKDFEKKHPGVYVNFEPLEREKGAIKLEAAKTTSTLPDIIPISANLEYMNDEILEPINEYITDEEKKLFKYQTLELLTINENIYGIPFMMTSFGMYLNVDRFTERGVELPKDGNWTYEEFVDKMKKLTFDEDGDGDVDHYGFTSFIAPDNYNLWGILMSDGARIFDSNNNYNFNDATALKGLNRVIDLKEKYKVTPDTFGIDSERESWTKFYMDKTVAVYPAGSWAVNFLEKNKSTGNGFNYTIANYPIGSNNVPISFNNSVEAYSITKQENKEKMKLCIELLKSVLEKENQVKLKNMGVFSVRKDVENLYPNNNSMSKLEEYIRYSKPVPKHKEWNEIDRILQNQIRLAIIGEKSSKEALEEANKQINILLQD